MQLWKGEIREVDYVPGDKQAYGQADWKKGKFIIWLSRKKNKLVAEYLATLLHELLHVWVKFVVRFGKVKLSGRGEHKFIEEVEAVVLFFFYRQFGLVDKALGRLDEKEKK